MTLTYKKNRNLLLVVSLLFLYSSTLAERFCFERSQSIHHIRLKIKEVLIKGEKAKIHSIDHCIEVTTSPDRIQFVSDIIRQSFKVKSNSSETIARQMCKIRVRPDEATLAKLETPLKDGTFDVIGMEGRKIFFDVANSSIQLICKVNRGVFDLSISPRYNKGRMTAITTSSGEWIEITSVNNNDAKKTNLILSKASVGDAKEVIPKDSVKFSIMVTN